MKLKEILLPTLALCVICVVFTGAMAVVHHVTKEPIEENLKLEATAARESMFPGAAFEERGDYFAAYQDRTLLGYIMETRARGYGGEIEVMTAVSPRGGVMRVRVLSAGEETPGLGQRITEEDFLGRFAGIDNPHEIDGITGATISSNGLKDAVRQALAIFSRIGGDAS